MRRSMVCAAAAFCGVISVAGAQEAAGPTRGTWGVETGQFTGASLLRFRTPAAAWLVGTSFQYSRVEYETDGAFGGPSDWEFSRWRAHLGHRWYRDAHQQTRPFITLGSSAVLGNLNNGWYGVGGFLEAGAVHFFSRHVSLGASSELRVEYNRDNYGGPNSPITRRTLGVTVGGVRMLAAVYF